MSLSSKAQQLKDIASYLVKEHAGLGWEAKQLESLAHRLESRDIEGLPPLNEEEKAIINSQVNTIAAIHSYRARTGASLMKAKTVFDLYRAERLCKAL